MRGRLATTGALSYIYRGSLVASKYCDSTTRSQVNLSHDSSRARRAVGRYAHRGLRSSTGPRTHRALRAPIFRACPCGSTGVHSHRPQSTELYMRKAYPNSFANGAQKSTTQTCLLTRKLGSPWLPCRRHPCEGTPRLRLRPTRKPTNYPHGHTPRRFEAEPR